MVKRYIALVVAILGIVLLVRELRSPDDGDGGGLTDFFRPAINLYLNAFNSPNVAVGLCIGMVVVAALVMAYYWFLRISPALRGLRDVAGRLREAVESGGALAQIEPIVSGSPVTSRSWTLFRPTLTQDAAGRWRSTMRLERYFDRKMLEISGLRLRLFLGLPNDFIGIGLIFTFLGLVAGLYFATESMMSSDLSAARDALVSLLHSATFKFLTSVTGIAISLVLSWMQRSILDRLQVQLDEIQFLLEQALPPASPAPVAPHPVRADIEDGAPAPVAAGELAP